MLRSDDFDDVLTSVVDKLNAFGGHGNSVDQHFDVFRIPRAVHCSIEVRHDVFGPAELPSHSRPILSECKVPA